MPKLIIQTSHQYFFVAETAFVTVPSFLVFFVQVALELRYLRSFVSCFRKIGLEMEALLILRVQSFACNGCLLLASFLAWLKHLVVLGWHWSLLDVAPALYHKCIKSCQVANIYSIQGWRMGLEAFLCIVLLLEPTLCHRCIVNLLGASICSIRVSRSSFPFDWLIRWDCKLWCQWVPIGLLSPLFSAQGLLPNAISKA